jgi:3-deoxy-7-phosphoheptulonate synthase
VEVIIRIESGADPAFIKRELIGRGLWPVQMSGDGEVYFLIRPHSAEVTSESLRSIRGISAIVVEASEHPKVDAQPGIVEVAGIRIGRAAGALGDAQPPVLMAGPCSVESEAQIHASAEAAARAGARFLRGGCFKPRTSPYSFQGHGEKALAWLRHAADSHGLKVVSEALRTEDAAPVAEVADLVQVGSRNMQNFALLATVGRTGKPVLLKRGMAATVKEWLLAGEHCLASGAAAVIFCERGIRGFDPSVRNLLDLGSVALLSHVHHQPVIVDPSHAVGRRDLIEPLSWAALAAGACGLLVETHPDPGNALSDGPQALSFQALADLGRSLHLS